MLCSGVRRVNIVKISILPKLIYKFNTFPIKIPVGIFPPIEFDRLILNFLWKSKGESSRQWSYLVTLNTWAVFTDEAGKPLENFSRGVAKAELGFFLLECSCFAMLYYFCCTVMWISYVYVYTYISSCLNFLLI